MTKLVQILREQVKEWPEGCTFMVQDVTGRVWPSRGDPLAASIGSGLTWASRYIDGDDFMATVADDYSTARVTRKEWESKPTDLEPVTLQELRTRVLQLNTDIAEYQEKLAELSAERSKLLDEIAKQGFRLL